MGVFGVPTVSGSSGASGRRKGFLGAGSRCCSKPTRSGAFGRCGRPGGGERWRRSVSWVRRRRTLRSSASIRRAWLSQPSDGQRTTVLGRIQHYPRPPRRALRFARLRGAPDSAGHDLRAAMAVMGRGCLGFPLSPVQVEPQIAVKGSSARARDVARSQGEAAFSGAAEGQAAGRGGADRCRG
jgi:hypothetical protein